MENWKRKAVELFPEIQGEISEADNPMGLWIEIAFWFDEAYVEPRNEDFIRRVYRFEEWCLEQDEGSTAAEHLPTCVVTAFWEHIPTNPLAREDMPRWFSIEEVNANRHIFEYLLDEGNFDELANMYSRSDLKLESGREFSK